jgi:hypothetical protein
MKKKIAWLTNLTNVGVLSFLVLKNFNPVCGAIACSISVLSILVAVIPEALKEGIVYNDEIN